MSGRTWATYNGIIFPQIFVFTFLLPFIAACDAPAPQASLPTKMVDSYSVASGMALYRAAPGVLANDTDFGDNLTARLVSEPKYGTLTLEEDGAFTYEPNYKFIGHDSFKYQAVDGERISEPVAVQIAYPNVIVILVDDLGLGDLRLYDSNAIVATPNLEALANAGMRFTHAHSAAAVCSPARYSILTGNYPYRGRLSSGIWNVYEPSTMLIPGQATLGDIFDEAGYQTGFVGKTHNGGAYWNRAGTEYTKNHRDIDFSRGFDRGPTQFGFDYSFLLPGGVSSRMYAYFENDRLVRFDPVSGKYETFQNNDDAHKHFVYMGQGWKSELNGGYIGAPGWAIDNYDARKAGSILTRKALEFMGQALARNNPAGPAEPFFLFFAAPQLHVPYSPPEYFNVTDSNDMEPATTGIAVAGSSKVSPRTDMILEIDFMVGAIVDFLEQRGQLDNTLIVFTSDNGPVWGEPEADLNPVGTDNGTPLRGLKGHVYEGGHRIPLLARWGDASRQMIPPASTSAQLLGQQDLAASFYSLLGRQRPANQANDSKSFLPVLFGVHPETVPLRDHMIVQGSPQSAYDDLSNVMDRAFYKPDKDGKLWKLSVISSNADPLAQLVWKELYNLSADPGEVNNLIDDPDNRQLLEAMQSEYLDLIVRPQTVLGFK